MSEKMQILQMVQEGKITVEEASKLLEAVDEPEESFEKPKTKGKNLRIKVYDPDDKTNVDIRIPMSLVRAGLKMGNAGIKVGSKFNSDLEALNGIDLMELEEALTEAEDGRIVDINADDGTIVKIEIEK